MHPLDTIGKHCDRIIKEIEDQAQMNINKKDFPFTHRNESITQATVRTFAKLFHSTQYFNEDIKTYLSDHFRKEALYYRFVGNRFHVFFLNSGILFSYFHIILRFYENVAKPKNSMEACIFNSLCNSVITNNLRALGLFGKAVTGPWMRLVSRKDLKILELSPFLNQAVTLLQKWAEDARPMLRPISVFGQDVPVLEDKVLSALVSSDLPDGAVCDTLQKLCSVAVDVLKRQLATQLPGSNLINF